MQLLKTLPIIILLTSLTAAGCVVIRDGEAGKDGTDGQSCVLLPGENGDSFILKCGEEEIQIQDGVDGVDGESCSIVEDEANGTYTVVCGQDSATIRDGEQGPAAAPCIISENQDGSTKITCGEDEVTIRDGDTGPQGESCTVKDNQDGTYTVTCGGSSVVISDGEDGLVGPEGPRGEPGPSCTVSEKDNGDFEIKCGESNVVISVITLGNKRWQQPPFNYTMNFEEAKTACADLGDDWRLPTLKELAILLTCDGEIRYNIEYDHLDGCNPCICNSCSNSETCNYVFGSSQNWQVGDDSSMTTFWSSTDDHVVADKHGYHVNFSNGHIGKSPVDKRLGVRCLFVKM